MDKGRWPRREPLQVSGYEKLKAWSRMKVVGVGRKGQMQELFCENRNVGGGGDWFCRGS